jgi:hypothetical protein
VPLQVCILSQKDDLVVQALSVDSLGSGIKVTAGLTALKRRLKAVDGCLPC